MMCLYEAHSPLSILQGGGFHDLKIYPQGRDRKDPEQAGQHVERQLIPARPADAGLLTRLTYPTFFINNPMRKGSATTLGHGPDNNQEKEKKHGKQSF